MKYLTPTDRYDIETFNDNFREIAERISQIEDDVEMTPEEVYATTRPADWLPMPMPDDDEIYLLVHILNGFSEPIAFGLTCTGNYLVETGTVVNGSFASQSVNVVSGTTFETELFANSYGDLTSDGFKQVIIKISGNKITSFNGSVLHSQARNTKFNIKEFSGKLPNVTTLSLGANNYLNMRYFALYGENSLPIGGFQGLFSGCQSLVAVLALDTYNFADGRNMYKDCYSLRAIPTITTHWNITYANQMFMNCRMLQTLSQPNLRVTIADSMFYGCRALSKAPLLDWSRTESTKSMYNNCSRLKKFPKTYMPKLKNAEEMFAYCGALEEVEELSSDAYHVATKSMFRYCNSLKKCNLKIPISVNSAYMCDSTLLSIVELCFSTLSTTADLTSFVNNCRLLKKLSLKKLGNSRLEIVSTNAFQYCYSLQSILFDPTVTMWKGMTVSLSSCSLSYQAIIDFFNSLPTITSSKAITLTGNPGVPDLTDADKAIATQKGWTLTL